MHVPRHNIATARHHIKERHDDLSIEGQVTDFTSAPEKARPEKAPADRKGLTTAFLRGLHVGLGLGGVVLVIATFLPLLHPFWPLADVAEHFALQLLMGAIPLGLIALLLRRWRWFSVVAAVALIQLWTIHPYWPAFIAGSTGRHAQAALTASPGEMKIVSLNVWYHNHDYEAVRRYLRGSNADVIGLVEVRPRMKIELAGLADLYPYQIDCVDADEECEEMLLSKHPFQRQGAGRIDGKLPVLVWGEIDVPGSNPMTVAVSHVQWPLQKIKAPKALTLNPDQASLPQDLPRLVQSLQVASLTHAIVNMDADLVLMGDFNAAPWSRIQQYLRRQSGLDNQGFLVPSWPAWGPGIIRLPIDHIMTRGTPRLISFQPGPNVGSDHLPVEAVVALSPQ